MSLILSGTDGLSDVDGSAATPAIRGTDANTGIFFPAADTIAFTEGGTEAMRIDSSGFVGIGTTSPRVKLDVFSGEAVISNGTADTASTGGTLWLNTGTSGVTRAAGIQAISTGIVNDHSLLFYTNAASTNPAERMRITDTGNVGIGTSSPTAKLHVAGGGLLGTSSTNPLAFTGSGSNLAGIGSYNANTDMNMYAAGTGNIKFINGVVWNSAASLTSSGTERMRIDSAGNVGIGTTTPQSKLSVNGNILAPWSNSGTYEIGVEQRTSNIFASTTNSFVVRGADAISGAQAMGGGSVLIRGGVGFGTAAGSAGNVTIQGGSGIGASAVTPGVIIFQTGATPTERMRIDSSGNLLVGRTALSETTNGVTLSYAGSSSTDAYILVTSTRADGLGAPLLLNRQGSDGTLIQFRQANTTEGTISVSGTTVSYNGGHLARWSQLLDNSKDESILKGTVLSNLDEMCVWEKDGVVAENEQLNKMKVSDVEGDTNVAGVFVNWTTDEDYNSDDMNIAMTGDMIIRIAEGVTVQRGDLLMSAGDGTAKPQGDDIVRSKTIAKVTSTNITCTYADGSYCVPCVLMAC
jgi:hypothetical protein